MSIIIKKNKSLNLAIPEFTCDNSPLGDHLNKYEMLKQLNGYFFTGIIGKPGSGKTSLLISFLNGRGKEKVFKKAFENILLVMPRSSRESMKINIFKDHHQDKMYEELTNETINDIYNKLLSSTELKEKTLLILDDVGASLKDSEIQKKLRQIIYNRRHLKVHIVVLLQSYVSIPKELRKMFNNIFMYKPSKVEFENLFEELFETKKHMAQQIMKQAYDKPHQYLMLSVESQRLFKGFDEMIITEND